MQSFSLFLTMPSLEKQSCPICKRYVKYSSRYPTYICQRCVPLATDKTGKEVVFYNTEFSGHRCAGKYRKNGKHYLYDRYYIKGIMCKANEAYLGGIIIII